VPEAIKLASPTELGVWHGVCDIHCVRGT